MFTGIIETLGTITHIEKEQDNLHLTISSEITNELKIDQSVAHNGVCLTVVEISDITIMDKVAIGLLVLTMVALGCFPSLMSPIIQSGVDRILVILGGI